MADKKKKGSFFGKFFFYLFLLLIVAAVTFYFIAGYTYSEGNRAGVLIKLSKRGYVFKTYEGELNQGAAGNVPNTAQFNSLWEFSVKDQAVADKLSTMEGKKVSLHYHQVVKNMPWDGETEYFVDGAEEINE